MSKPLSENAKAEKPLVSDRDQIILFSRPINAITFKALEDLGFYPKVSPKAAELEQDKALLKKELASTYRQASEELREKGAYIKWLETKAQAYDVICAISGSLPSRTGGGSAPDLAWELDRKLSELKAGECVKAMHPVSDTDYLEEKAGNGAFNPVGGPL